MKSLMIAASFAALSLSLPAMAETADPASCRALSKEASAALNGATGDVTEARAETRLGLQSCNFGQWENGVAHYRKALSLLGK